MALFGCFPIIHLVLGIALVTGALDDQMRPAGTPAFDASAEESPEATTNSPMAGPPNLMRNRPPAAFGWIFVGFAAFMIAIFWCLAIASILAGRRLAAHRSYTFCLVVASIECLFAPVGTVLGVFTIVVLMRPTVKELFGESPATVATSPTGEDN